MGILKLQAIASAATLTFLVVGVQAATGVDRSLCPAPAMLPEELVNPVGIKSYVEANKLKIKSVEDLICCLPKSYRTNYAIAHSSQAGQNSNPHNPRVLLFKTPERKRTAAERKKCLKDDAPLQGEEFCDRMVSTDLTGVLSITGTDPSLTNANSVEYMFNNTQRGELEFYDINFEGGKSHFSEKNPQLCINCHGKQGELTVGGPRTIFDPFESWVRFVDGTISCNEHETKLLDTLNKAAKEALKKSPRYKCLVPKGEEGGGALFGDLSDLDKHLGELNERRTAKILRSTPEFDKYKFAVIGALVCQPETSSGSSSPWNPAEWIPKEVLKKHDSKSFLLPAVASASDLRSTFRTLMQRESTKASKAYAAHRAEAAALASGKSPEFNLYTGPLTCGTMDSIPDLKLTGVLSADRFIVDAQLRRFRPNTFSDGTTDAMLRFLFEGRGIDLTEIGMAPTPGDYRRSSKRSLVYFLVRGEPANSPLKKYSDRLLRDGVFEVEKTAFSDIPGACDELKKLSIEAFTSQGEESAKPKPIRSSDTDRR